MEFSIGPQGSDISREKGLILPPKASRDQEPFGFKYTGGVTQTGRRRGGRVKNYGRGVEGPPHSFS